MLFEGYKGDRNIEYWAVCSPCVLWNMCKMGILALRVSL